MTIETQTTIYAYNGYTCEVIRHTELSPDGQYGKFGPFFSGTIVNGPVIRSYKLDQLFSQFRSWVNKQSSVNGGFLHQTAEIRRLALKIIQETKNTSLKQQIESELFSILNSVSVIERLMVTHEDPQPSTHVPEKCEDQALQSNKQGEDNTTHSTL